MTRPSVARSVSCRRFSVVSIAFWAAASLGCGPSIGDGDADAGASGEAGEPEDDLSWLVGKFTESCSTDFESAFVDGCSAQRFDEFEFHADGTMTAVDVLCGVRGKRPEVAVFAPGPEPGTATVTPAEGFDFIWIPGSTATETTVSRTEDCLIISARNNDRPDNVFYYLRGSFDYRPPTEGCDAEAFPTEVPECPTE